MSEFITQEIRHWTGVRLDRERTDLELDELAYAVNADLFLEPGVIRTRRGSSKLTTSALSDLILRRVARVNSTRYQVGGTTLYRAGTSIQTSLHSNQVTTIQPYRPLNDTSTWAFIADASGMKKDDATNLRNWGLTAPATAPVLAPTAGSLTGSYNAEYTYVRKVGSNVIAESNPSSAGTAQTLATNGLALIVVSSTDAQITHIRIYRTVAGGASYLYDQEIANPITSTNMGYAFLASGDLSSTALSGLPVKITTDTTVSADYQVTFGWEKQHVEASTITAGSGYTVCFPWEADQVSQTYTWTGIGVLSTQADSALGAAAETDNDVPPSAGFVSPPDDGRFWITQDPTYPHYVYYTKRFRPEAVPAANYLEITTPEDPAQCVIPFGGIRVAFCKARKYRIIGTGAGPFTPQETPSKRGTPSWATACAGEDGIYFLARDGIFRTNGFGADEQIAGPILPLFKGQSRNGYSPINWDQASKFCLIVFEGLLYVSWADGSNTSPNIVWVNRIGTEKWEPFQYGTGISSLWYEEDTGYLSAGGQDGFVYQLETGSDDAGSSLTMTADSKDYAHVLPESPGGPMARHLFRFMQEDLEGGTVSTTFYADGTAQQTTSVSSTRVPSWLALPSGAQGYRWRKRWAYTGTAVVRIYGTSVKALPFGNGNGAGG